MMSLPHILTIAILSVALIVPVPSRAQGTSPSATSGLSRSASTADSATFAQPGDVVRLRIWREPDMSGDFTVDAKGIATFPRLGSLQVTRIDADSLQRMLVAEYARYLKNPAVEVVLLRRVRVVGAVRTPGLYTADQTMRIRDVLALAGGASADGRTDRVRIDRDGRAMTLNLNASPRGDEFPLRSGDQLFVPERSWISRNTPLVAAVLSVSGGLLIAFSAR